MAIGRQDVTVRLAVENTTDERCGAGARGGSLSVGTPQTVLLSTSLRL